MGGSYSVRCASLLLPLHGHSDPNSSTFKKALSSGNERRGLSVGPLRGSVGTLEGAGRGQEEEISILTKVGVSVVEWSAQSQGAGT